VERLAPRRRRPWWHLLVDRARLAVEYRRSAGTAVADVMTQPTASDAEKAALITMARSIPGCRGIDDHLVVKGAMHRYYEIV
jgi:hypothetical protein